VQTVAQLKDEVIQMIERLPDDAGISDIMAELYFRQRVDAGLKELDEGKGISHDQVRERLAKWLS
jgi:predicted transcriptional regulator